MGGHDADRPHAQLRRRAREGPRGPYTDPVTSTQLSPGAETVEDQRTQPLDGEDRERFSHYVEKDKLTEAMVMGTPVRALCGKVWVPSRDPERFPTCPECQEAWEKLPKDDD